MSTLIDELQEPLDDGADPAQHAGTGVASPTGHHGEHRADEIPSAIAVAPIRPPAVQVRDLVKKYPHAPANAVDGLSFDVRPGEVFGLLGPNGAGKTTTIGILTTRVRPTSGTATVAGVNVAEHPVRARNRMSVVPQQSNLDLALTARQNLIFHAAYHGIGRAERSRRADALLEQVGLTERGGDKVDKFSGGMRQRLLIARALMHGPEVLFLDEPATGLDPQARLFVWDRIHDLRANGVTTMLTTHDMTEAAALCDRVAIMDHGKLLALDTPSALTAALPGSGALQLVVRTPTPEGGEPLRVEVGQLSGIARAELAPDTLALEASPSGGATTVAMTLYTEQDSSSLIGAIVERVTASGGEVVGLRAREATLEDVFIRLTGRELR